MCYFTKFAARRALGSIVNYAPSNLNKYAASIKFVSTYFRICTRYTIFIALFNLCKSSLPHSAKIIYLFVPRSNTLRPPPVSKECEAKKNVIETFA